MTCSLKIYYHILNRLAIAFFPFFVKMIIFVKYHKGEKLFLSICITGLTQKTEHILLVGLNTGLVEGIYLQNVAADGTGKFKEINHITEVLFVCLFHCKNDGGNAAVLMGKSGAAECVFVNEIHISAFQIAKTVHIGFGGGDGKVNLGGSDLQHGFKHGALTLLHVLTERVQVTGINGRYGENALAVLTLGFTVKLLEPFAHQFHSGGIGSVHLEFFALAIENIAKESILHTDVFFNVKVIEFFFCFQSACHHCIDIGTADCNGKKTHGGENGVSAADVAGYYKAFIAALGGKFLEGAGLYVFIGGNEDALFGLFLAVFLFNQFTEHAEGNSGLGGGT